MLAAPFHGSETLRGERYADPQTREDRAGRPVRSVPGDGAAQQELIPDNPGPLDWYYTVTVEGETSLPIPLHLRPGTLRTKAEAVARAAIDKS